MNGTLLATILSPVLTLAVGFALLARFQRKEQPEAVKTRKGRAADFVTREEVDELIEQYTKELEFTNTEWYDKFNALHQRLAKREKRGKQPPPEEQVEADLESGVPDIRQFRRLGSL